MKIRWMVGVWGTVTAVLVVGGVSCSDPAEQVVPGVKPDALGTDAIDTGGPAEIGYDVPGMDTSDGAMPPPPCPSACIAVM